MIAGQGSMFVEPRWNEIYPIVKNVWVNINTQILFVLKEEWEPV